MEKIRGIICLMVAALFFVPTILAATSECELAKDKTGMPNNPPGKPTIVGPTQGIINTSYTYFVSAEDPEGDKIRYNFDWGDGCEYCSACCFCSGELCEVCHCWNCNGVFKIRVRALDEHFDYGEWSDTLRVTMPIDYHFSLELITDSLLQLIKITIN